MAKARATIQDVARHLGVNASTVSRALNPETQGMVKAVTVRRVREAAERLDYQPNRMAYALKKQQSRTIGILVPDLMNPLFPPIIRGIEGPLEAAGYTPVIANTDNDEKRKRDAVASMRGQFVDGLIMAASTLKDPVVETCIEHGLPLVTINRTVATVGGLSAVHAVVSDERHGIHLAVAHLVALGHARIAHVAGPAALSTGQARRAAFIESMRAHGLTADQELIVPTTAFTEDAGAAAFAALLAGGRDFTAVIAGNDLIALGCLDVMAERGLGCPDDMSLVGYNDIPMMDRISPPLTTVAVPLFDLGEQAARTLLECIINPAMAIKTVTLKPGLIVRASTAPPRRNPI